MTLREQLLAFYRRQNTGKIPWAAYGGFLLPTGWNERQLRNAGCGWIQWAPVCSWLPPGMSHMNGWMFESEAKNVEMSVRFCWKDGHRAIHRVYETPVGSVWEELREEPGYHSLWVKKFFIETPGDYEVMKYIVEHTVFRPSYEAFLEAQANLGEDGVELAVVDRSPFQKMLLELCGTERLTFDLLENREMVEDLMQTMDRKQDEAFALVARSPADAVWIVDNITGDITTPDVFRRYCAPFYKKQMDLLHRNGKVAAVHFDGRLKSIQDLIAATDIDCIESFTLPEMGGNVPIEAANSVWKDKSVAANIPACLCQRSAGEVREFLEGLLARVAPRKNFMLELSENFPPDKLRTVLPIVADVMSRQ
jgi:hypothetical protein